MKRENLLTASWNEVVFAVYQTMIAVCAMFIAKSNTPDHYLDAVAWICGSAIVMWYLRWTTAYIDTNACKWYRHLLWLQAPMMLLATVLMPYYTAKGFKHIAYYTTEESYEIALGANTAEAVGIIFLIFAIPYVWKIFKATR